MLRATKETPSTAPQERPVQEAQVTTELLSGRERAVLAALGRGLIAKEIADEFDIAEGTVRSMLARVFLKLQVRDRDAALRRARRMNLL
jgi:DNA-binding NarL/FixJ family response regulator